MAARGHEACRAPQTTACEPMVKRQRHFGTDVPGDTALCASCFDAHCPRIVEEGLDVVMSLDLKTATCSCCGRSSRASR
jgi:hypothetical protein